MTPAELEGQVPSRPVSVFVSYAHEDEALRRKLGTHMSTLKRTGWVREWHDRMILPGQSWADQIDEKLEAADMILLLVSPDFVASDYCHEVEMKRALERHNAGQAVVVPVVLRPIDIKGLHLEKLQGLPTDLKPVTDWVNEDAALFDVVSGLRRLILAWRTGDAATSGDAASDTRASAHGARELSKGRARPAPGSAQGSPASPGPSAASLEPWQAELQRRLARQLKACQPEPLFREFVALLRERDPDWDPNLTDEFATVAEYLANGAGDRYERVALFLVAASRHTPTETSVETVQQLFAYLLQTLVRKCRDDDQRGLVRVPAKHEATVELLSASRATVPRLPGYGRAEREHRNGQRNALLRRVGHFSPETGTWDVESVCMAIARDLLRPLGFSSEEAELLSDPLIMLRDQLQPYDRVPEDLPLHGIVVEHAAVHNPVLVEPVASRLRQALGELFAVYVYGDQSDEQSVHLGP